MTSATSSTSATRRCSTRCTGDGRGAAPASGKAAPGTLSNVRTDPTDTGGLFVGRRPGTAPIRYRALPERGSVARQTFDRAVALGIAMLMVFINLLFWGPLPAAWLWVGAQVDYNTDSVSGGIAVSFVGMMLTLIAALAVLKRLDHVWILVRRAAGYDQRKGI